MPLCLHPQHGWRGEKECGLEQSEQHQKEMRDTAPRAYGYGSEKQGDSLTNRPRLRWVFGGHGRTLTCADEERTS